MTLAEFQAKYRFAGEGRIVVEVKDLLALYEWTEAALASKETPCASPSSPS